MNSGFDEPVWTTVARGPRIRLFAVSSLGLLLPALCPSASSADVDLVTGNGWRVTTSGRTNAFYSQTFGQGFPETPLDSSGRNAYSYIPGGGLNDAPLIVDDKNNIANARIRSGIFGSFLALAVRKDLGPWATVTGYFALWTGVQTQHQRFQPVTPDVREAYLRAEGSWGSVLAGRTLGLFGRTSVDIDTNYGHAYGLGYPCQINTTALASCGQIGFGALDPFNSAGIVYRTPALARFTLATGLYDPVIYSDKWALTPLPRLEAQLSYAAPLGEVGTLSVAAEGLWQRVGRSTASTTTDASGVAGGVRVEVGPTRFGAAAYYGPGLGFYYALEDSQASTYFAGPGDPPGTLDGQLRLYAGYYEQAMLILGNRGSKPVDWRHPRLDIATGYGIAHLFRIEGLDVNRTDGGIGNPGLPKDQEGFNAGVYYHLDDNLVLGVDYFRARFSWYDGVTQTVNTLNAGATATW